MSPTQIDAATRQLDQAHSFALVKAPSMKTRVVTFLCVMMAGLLGSCGAARPSKYYQLTVPGGAGEQMGTYEYQRWAEPPTEMVQEVLLRALRSSGRFRAVYVQRSNINGDFLLRGRIYDFKEVSGNPMTARVTMELEMRDLKAGATVWTHYYQHDEPVSGKDVPAVVAALDRNVQLGVKEVLGSLQEYFAAHPAK